MPLTGVESIPGKVGLGEAVNPPSAGDLGVYTKNESDARYIVDVQIGAGTNKTTWNASGRWPNTAGYVITSVWKDAQGDNLDGVVYAPLQKKINNIWYTIVGGTV